MEISSPTGALARFGHALSDLTRTRVLLVLRDGPAYPADLAELAGVSRQTMSNHLACLRGCGLVVATPDGRRTRYELADAKIGHALQDLLELVLVVDPDCWGQPNPTRERGRCSGGGTAVVTTISLALSPTRRAVLARRIQIFVALTITYNMVEAVVAMTAGTQASSSALIGFGLDSIIEVASAAAVAWQFTGRDPEGREHVALKIIACSFFGLALFVSVDAARTLIGIGEARHSVVGLILAAVSLAVMPVLSYAQRRAGRELGSASAVADSKQTLLCTYLSAVLLVGLGLNWLFGWTWADPIAALVIAAVAVKEGVQAWRGDPCCAPNATLLHTGPTNADGELPSHDQYETTGSHCATSCEGLCCSNR